MPKHDLFSLFMSTFYCVGTVLRQTLFQWIPGRITLLTSNRRICHFFWYLITIPVVRRIKKSNAWKTLTAEPGILFLTIFTLAQNLALSGPGLVGIICIICIYPCTYVSISQISCQLLRSRIQHSKTLWNRRKRGLEIRVILLKKKRKVSYAEKNKMCVYRYIDIDIISNMERITPAFVQFWKTGPKYKRNLFSLWNIYINSNVCRYLFTVPGFERASVLLFHFKKTLHLQVMRFQGIPLSFGSQNGIHISSPS